MARFLIIYSEYHYFVLDLLQFGGLALWAGLRVVRNGVQIGDFKIVVTQYCTATTTFVCWLGILKTNTFSVSERHCYKYTKMAI